MERPIGKLIIQKLKASVIRGCVKPEDFRDLRVRAARDMTIITLVLGGTLLQPPTLPISDINNRLTAVGDYVGNFFLTGPQRTCKEDLQSSALINEKLVVGSDGANVRNKPDASAIGGSIVGFLAPGASIDRYVEVEGRTTDGSIKGTERWLCIKFANGILGFSRKSNFQLPTQPSK